MANRPTKDRTYGTDNTAPPWHPCPSSQHTLESLEMSLWTQLAVLAYRADQALPLIDMMK